MSIQEDSYEPPLGQDFTIAQHLKAQTWDRKMRRYGFKAMVELDHKRFPELIGIYLPEAWQTRWAIWRDLDGNLIVDCGRSGRTVVTCRTMDEALMAVEDTLATLAAS